jgi:hypothetical protein
MDRKAAGNTIKRSQKVLVMADIHTVFEKHQKIWQ